MTTETIAWQADRDYPRMIAETDHVGPAPRRVRATLGGEQIFDTTRARYVSEWPYYLWVPKTCVTWPDALLAAGHSAPRQAPASPVLACRGVG
jgi:uncharacterized protein (DUF427 family)